MKSDAFGSEAECEDCGWQGWVEDLPRSEIEFNCYPSCGSIHIYELKDEDEDIDAIIEELKELRANRDEDEAARLEAELPKIGCTDTVAIFIKRRRT